MTLGNEVDGVRGLRAQAVNASAEHIGLPFLAVDLVGEAAQEEHGQGRNHHQREQ